MSFRDDLVVAITTVLVDLDNGMFVVDFVIRVVGLGLL